ncbi:MAG: TetR/AcrR family transcriptional regulator [Clostridia bacterium]|nr:TetR/AcrR family transcriptional regulator [Clostridia bacterium]MBR0219951.1 TetR/AcrR family transcriptional regulator [Clostridia bacterium]
MTEGPENGKIDRRIQRTYQQLTEAMGRLLLRKEWNQITVQELCDEAVIRRTTFYQHFRDMHDFMLWRRKDRLKEFSAFIAEDDPPKEPGDYFVLLSSRVMDYMNLHPQYEKVVMETGERGIKMLEAFLRHCADEVVLRLNERGGMNQENSAHAIPVLTEFYVGGMLAALRWWYANRKPCTEEELIDYLRRIVERNREQ